MQNGTWRDRVRRMGGVALMGGCSIVLGLLMISSEPDHSLAASQDRTPLPERVAAATQAPGGEASVGASEQIKKQVIEAYGRLPLTFVKNEGQINPQVQYYGQGRGAKVYFTASEILFAFAKPAARHDRTQVLTPVALREKDRGTALSLEFLGANPKVRVAGRAEQEGKVNYFVGNNPALWQTDLATYREVAYKDLWPGVEAAFRDEGGSLKYEFRLQAGTRVEAVQLAYNGSESLSLDDAGNLQIKTPLGVLTDVKPTSYQMLDGRKVPVQSRFALRQGDDGRNVFGFEVAAYDPAYPLTIDPGLVYSTYVGTDGPDDGYGIQVDANGNAYVTGDTERDSFPVTAGAFDTLYGGYTDAFVLKLNATGTALIYSTYLGGNGSDIGEAIAVDASGNAYVAISTSSSDMPVMPSSVFQPALQGSTDVYVAKLNATGKKLQLGTYLGGSGYDAVQGIALDSSANVYLAGYTQSVDFPTSAFPYDSTANGGYDAYVAKLNAALSTLSYSTYLGGSSDDSATGLAVDHNGLAYVTGNTTSTDFPTTAGAFDTSANGGSDIFVTAVNPPAQGAASLYNSTYLGGSLAEYGGGIAVDNGTSAYVTGYTFSTDFPTTAGAFDTSFNGGNDAFVSKLFMGGNALVYSTFLGGTSGEAGRAIAVDAFFNAYVTGDTASSDFPVTPVTAVSATYNGGTDVFVTRLNPTGASLLYSTFLGGNWADRAFALALGAQGQMYVTGHTGSSDFPTTPGAFDMTHNGVADVFVAKLIPVAEGSDFVITEISGPSQAVRGTTISVTTTVYNQGTQGGGYDFFKNGIYLSEFPTLTGWNILVATGERISLAPGQSYTDTLPSVLIPTTSRTGNLYLVSKADWTDVIQESDENNNTRSQPINITKK